ncbi:hypothetical protein CpipJ_CPIJ015876, partial [Culex quinquefasciatus]
WILVILGVSSEDLQTPAREKVSCVTGDINQGNTQPESGYANQSRETL